MYYTVLFVSLMLYSSYTDYSSSYRSAKTREYTGELMEGIIQGFYRLIKELYYIYFISDLLEHPKR